MMAKVNDLYQDAVAKVGDDFTQERIDRAAAVAALTKLGMCRDHIDDCLSSVTFSAVES